MNPTGWAGLCVGVASLLCALLTSACTRTVQVRSQDPTETLFVDGVQLTGNPAPAQIGIGGAGVPFEVHAKDGRVALGDIERSEPVWWLISLGAAGAACCAPSLAGAGFVVANPTLWFSPLAVATTGDIGVVTRSFTNPSWVTVPAMAACGTLGALPLAVVFVSEMPTDDVALPAPTAPQPVAAPLAMRF